MGFTLTKGTDTFEFDTSGAGAVKKNGAVFGSWNTDDHNKLLAKPADGSAPITFDVVWRFTPQNELCLFNGNMLLINFHAERRPSYKLDRTILIVQPAFAKSHQFSVRGTWNLSSDMTLQFQTLDGQRSTISGSLSDPRGRFLYVIRSLDPAHGSHQSSLLFTGRWIKDPGDSTKLNFLFQAAVGHSGRIIRP